MLSSILTVGSVHVIFNNTFNNKEIGFVQTHDRLYLEETC